MITNNNYFHYLIAFYFIQKILYNDLFLVRSFLIITEYITELFSRELFPILSKNNHESNMKDWRWERYVLFPFILILMLKLYIIKTVFNIN